MSELANAIQKVAIYGRVSTEEQAEGKNIDSQIEELRKYEIEVIEFRGYANKEVFEDIKRIFLESYLSKGTLPNFAYFFHCGISYFDPGDSEDPNYLAKEELGLKINLNVGIQNKKLNPGELCEFSMFSKELDFIINNLD